jgi:outer membrane protein assembly factor BamB/predicted MPP superfamily phosphohydrolase
MLRYFYSIFIGLLLSSQLGYSQTFRFAQVTDTHVGGHTGLEDLARTVEDLNAQKGYIDFVVLSGDITEFGSDEELQSAKAVLDQLELPWYIVPGNHDTNWSESGGNSFRTVFGDETFSFTHKGYLFLGTNSGPNMRMSPGQVPRENIVWLDSVLAVDAPGRTPIIYINHYPQDSALNNWFDAVDRLKMHNIQLALCGHGHQNRLYDFDGIPGVMSRSNLRAADTVGAYNIVSIYPDQATFTLRYPGVKTAEKAWLSVPLFDRQLQNTLANYPRPSYAVNEKYADRVSVQWTYQDQSDIGAGIVAWDDVFITSNTAGQVYALDQESGRLKWKFQTDGKVYSTPEVWNHLVFFGSTDQYIYCLDAKNGELKWKFKTDKAVLGSPAIQDGIGYIGASDGKFRAFDLSNGTLIWAFEGVKGYVSGKPLIYQNKVYFGSWGNDFYALDLKTGLKVWEWSNGSASRNLSPAACYPVASNGRVFLVAPDRFMTALDAETGAVIWRENKEKELGLRVRESMGLSEDGKFVYVKTMDGNVFGISTTSDFMDIKWKSTLQLPYELTPTALLASDQVVFVPSHAGLLSAVQASSGDVLWQYKISNAMINPMTTISGRKMVASTMDGKIVMLKF